MQFQEIKQKFKEIIYHGIAHIFCEPYASESPGVVGRRK